jgi:hypothetical protein
MGDVRELQPKQSAEDSREHRISVRAFIPVKTSVDDYGQVIEDAFVPTTEADLPTLRKALGLMRMIARENARRPRKDADDLKRFILAKFGSDALSR